MRGGCQVCGDQCVGAGACRALGTILAGVAELSVPTAGLGGAGEVQLARSNVNDLTG
jgi:hypothetical protein